MEFFHQPQLPIIFVHFTFTFIFAFISYHELPWLRGVLFAADFHFHIRCSVYNHFHFHWHCFFLSIFYYDGLWHFQFAEHWALKNTTKMITKKKHVTWASLLLCNDKLQNHSHMPYPLDLGICSHSQSVQGTVQSIFDNRRSVLLESDSGRSTWVAGAVVEQE